MKKIKLTGREQAVLKAIDFSTGTPGDEVLLRTRLEVLELVEIVNGLLDAGFIECSPAAEHVAPDSFPSTMFDVNPSYALDLREAMTKRY